MTNILAKILKAVRKRLKARKQKCPLPEIIRQARRRRPPDFVKALRKKGGLAVIAELKRSSPSSPNLSPRLNLLSFARRYQSAGAAAISVLTEEDHFGGSLNDLRIVSAGVKLPVLRKDFTLDEYQIYEAKACGAAAVLLIVWAMNKDRLRKLHRLARRIGLSPLVEVHDENELEAALSVGARLIGVNNRNLDTLTTDLNVARRLLPLIPRTCVAVAESGYSKWDEIEELRGLADAVLIGTAFLKNPGKIRRLLRAV